MRSPVLAYRHPERSRGIFYVVAVLCIYEVMIKSPRCFGCSSSDALRLIVVQGRFLALLEMTIRGKRYSRIVSLLQGEAAFSLLPMEGGAPKGRRLESPRYEREYEESGLSYRHPERSRGIFYVAAVLCTYEVMIKSRGCFGCSSSDALRLTVVRGRFLAALEMTRGGRTVIRGRACSLLAFPTFSAKRSHFLRKECIRNPHFPPILSAFSHREAPRGSSMDFFKNKRVFPHFLQI